MISFVLLLVIYMGMFAILSLSQNLITGLTGMLSLCHAAFFAIGAYTMAIGLTSGLDFWTCFVLAGLLSAALGVLIGLPTLRLRGDYLAIATLGLGEITRNVILNWDALTRGPLGINSIPAPEVFGTVLSPVNKPYFVLIVWGYVLIVWFLLRTLGRSRLGLALDAIREDEIAASSMGINVTKYKVWTFALGAFIAGQAGIFWTTYSQSVSPGSFDFMLSVMVLCMVVLGGQGNYGGAILGAVIIQLISELPRLLGVSHLIPPQIKQILFGLVLVLMMILRPQGILVRKRIYFGPGGGKGPGGGGFLKNFLFGGKRKRAPKQSPDESGANIRTALGDDPRSIAGGKSSIDGSEDGPAPAGARS